MKNFLPQAGFTRRTFFKIVGGGVLFSLFKPFTRFVSAVEPEPLSNIFWVRGIPDQPFPGTGSGNYHSGVESLLSSMGQNGLKLYRSSQETELSGPEGMIEPDDVVLIKVNGQWKYRGCTNSDLIRGLIQRILDHPDGFNGEVVIFENGQGRGSLNCDTSSSYSGNTQVHANANDERQSFLYLVNTLFRDPRVSSFLLDPIRNTFISADDHVTNGYRKYENVSYPCFTTAGGHRVELQGGLWEGDGYSQNLKLINVPVLKHHDAGGSEITASLKHLYGILSMSDGNSPFRHYSGLGETCGKMMVSVRTPVLNILDAIWVSYASITGYPASTTRRTNQILASQDPVALDYWGAKYVIYPIDHNPNHHPDYPGISRWLSGAENMINGRGGLFDPQAGIMVDLVTKDETKMVPIVSGQEPVNSVVVASPNGGEAWQAGTSQTIRWIYAGNAGASVKIELLKGGKFKSVITSSALIGSNGSGSYAWSIPSNLTNGGDYSIRITSVQDNWITDTSDNFFAITSPPPPSIMVILPNGAETWQAGTSQTIRWNYSGKTSSYVKIELLKGGVRKRTITSSVSIGKNGSGSYVWRVPSTLAKGGDYSIRVKSTGRNTISDTSDNYFSVT